MSDHPFTDLREMWEEAGRKAIDWREAGEPELLKRLHDAQEGLKSLGWRDISYCPKDGSRFLVITAGSTGVFTCTYSGEWPKGTWMLEAHGDLWPSSIAPLLFKPMPVSAVAAKVQP